MITPAISVLSAVEGIVLVAPGFHTLVIPITLAILAGLFWVQRQGTGMERVVSTPKPSGMAHWRERLFAFMIRNTQRPSMHYHLPRERVIEVGVQVEI